MAALLKYSAALSHISSQVSAVITASAQLNYKISQRLAGVSLAQLRICREGDFARSHQLCFDVVQPRKRSSGLKTPSCLALGSQLRPVPRSSHAKDVPGLLMIQLNLSLSIFCR